MVNWDLIHLNCPLCFLIILALSQPCIAIIQQYGTILPGFQASQMSSIDDNGLFLLSNDSTFALGFQTTENVTLFKLVIIHQDTSMILWTANGDSPVANSDKFVFNTSGSVSLQSEAKTVWKPDTGGKPVSAIQLLDSGNLVLLGSDNSTVLWESFQHPTNTLISNQEFMKSMQLYSDPDPTKPNVTHFLEIKSGDMILSSGYNKTPQIYWSMRKDSRKILNKDGGVVNSAKIVSNSWRFYDENKTLLWQFIFSSNPYARNSTWIMVLQNNGFLAFYNLGNGPSKVASQVRIPREPCETPEPCGAYFACSSSRCRCPSGLVSRSCNVTVSDQCLNQSERYDLINAGEGLSYFALKFSQPYMRADLNACKASCASNCSCLGLIFDESSSNCYLFDWIGSFLSDSSSRYSVYVKASRKVGVEEGNGRSNRKHLPIVLTIVFVTVLIVVMAVYGGYKYLMKKKTLQESFLESPEEDDSFFGSISAMPVRYSYRSLQEATSNFSLKLGQGGFGSVYKGNLPDGTPLAVKKLEGFDQGKKEFRAEVSIIGGIHHIHLVRLKGFCAEGSHRLLAYEFMPNGSLDKWIFKRDVDNGSVLDWPARFNIAIGTAKGLAYLHEDCEVKIVHCDIKPENVLLDEHFEARVSDFGLAKLMTREQSHVFTTLRGTRGYLAPEWLTNYAISEKSDVYSYGMVLLEIIGGRKNYDPSFSSEKSHFPAYASKMMEEGNLREIVDSSLEYDPNDESVRTAIKVALWCIHEDMSMRPPMSIVVQMLEGVSPVPDDPPMFSSAGGPNLESFYVNQGSRTGRWSGLSAVQLSGPR
ncbi:G-type lectin S-receptor-like serine/threonine-protein kinase SD2-5 [Bienertia sinuspersici]